MARKEKIECPIETPTEFQNPFAGLPVDNLALGSSPAPEKPDPAGLGRVVLRRETHHGAKTVIIVHDFAASISGNLIHELARKLRDACGCVGTIRRRTIQIQGNEMDKVRDVLEHEGFCVAAG